MICLYDYILSDECYKVRLLLSMLRVPFETVKVNVHPGEEHRRPDFLALNPLGTMPVLTDGDLVLRGALPILCYVAQTHDPARHWYPAEPAASASVLMWLDFAERAMQPISLARANNLFGIDEPVTDCLAAGEAALVILDDHLAAGEIAGRHWIAADHPTIADLALFPAAALSPETGLCLDTKPAAWRWMERIKRLPDFIVMPGVLPLLS